MEKIEGIVGSGMIGRDPWDPTCWSGSGYRLFKTMDRLGVLKCAHGLEAPSWIRYPLMLKNFHVNKSKWINRFYLDTDYYRQLTLTAEKQIDAQSGSKFLQLGAIYDIPSIVPSKTCYSYHDGNIVELKNSGYLDPSLFKRADRAFEWEKSVCQSQEKVFTMSEYLRQSFINDFEIAPEKVVNVGVGLNFHMPEEVPDKDEDVFHILFVGIDFKRKGGEQLVEAFNQLGNPGGVRLHIVGPREVPEALADNANENIKFWGYLDKQVPEQSAQLEKLFKSSHLFVLPSLYEPFGIAVLEAMSYGMPVIATNKWAFPEMITPGINGQLCELRNTEHMASLLLGYIDNREGCKAQGLQARQSVIDRYSWEQVAMRLSKEMGVDY